MENHPITISQLENQLYTMLHGTVSNYVYAGTPPETLQSSWTEMVLIDCGVPMMDMGAFQSGTALIWLYAKPLSDGRKNVAVMNKLETDLKAVIEAANDDTYRFAIRDVYADYDSTRKWHANIVELIVNIY